jgi:hypothetical protein
MEIKLGSIRAICVLQVGYGNAPIENQTAVGYKDCTKSRIILHICLFQGFQHIQGKVATFLQFSDATERVFQKYSHYFKL